MNKVKMDLWPSVNKWKQLMHVSKSIVELKALNNLFFTFAVVLPPQDV